MTGERGGCLIWARGEKGRQAPMYRPREPQTSLFGTSMLLPEEKRRRLEKTWAWAFRTCALPLIDEEQFRELYHPDNGRPNKPVQTVVGLLILKEMWDLTDEQALFNLDFNLAWQVALDLTPEEAHCCQKTLHNFRAKLMASENETSKLLFEGTTDRIIRALELKTEKQRLDSTHIISNIAMLTRLGLFCETSRVFLRELRRASRERFESVPAGLRGRYLKEDGTDSSYGDARSSEGRRRLGVCARDVWRLVDRFKGDEEVEGLESYGLLKRLLEEQCEIKDEAQPASPDDADAGDPPAPVVLKNAKDVGSNSLQSPHDADATYSGHKGKGFEAQIAETLGNGEKPEMLTYAEVTPSCGSDEDATMPTVDELAGRDMQPEELIADTNFGSTENVIECEEKGTELVSPAPGGEVRERAEGEIRKCDFEIDPKGEKKARCPAGHERLSENCDAQTGKVRVFFDARVCETCPMREKCPAKRVRDGRRVLRTTVHAAVLARRRRYERTEEFKKRYAERAGIEGTNSELKRAHGLGRLRVRGLKRVRLAVYLKALACNVKRMVRWVAQRSRETDAAAAGAGESVSRVLTCFLGPRGAFQEALAAIRERIGARWAYASRAAAA